MQKLQIKNMVCPRCVMAVENVLDEMKISPIEVRLGEVLITDELTENQENDFKSKIEKLGFELFEVKKDYWAIGFEMYNMELTKTYWQ